MRVVVGRDDASLYYTPSGYAKGLRCARALWCGMYCEACAFRGRARCGQA